MDVIGEGDENNNLEDDKFSGDSTTDTESTTASVATNDTGRTSITTSSTSAKSKTKKKVAESWEDSDAEEAGEQEETNGALRDELSKSELEKGFLNIYKAMTKLRSEFDTKFRKIFA